MSRATNHLTNAKVAVYTADLDNTFTETKGTVLLNTAKELKDFSRGEEDLLENKIDAIKAAGVSVIVTGGKVGDMALHFCNRAGLLIVKLNSKFELKRLCRATGATALPVLTPPTAHEIGFCAEVAVEEIGEVTVTVFKQNDASSAVSTIVVRGATPNIMDDIERVLDDGINVYKSLTREQRLLPGAGAPEIELARRVFSYGETCAGLEQYAIKSFAEALEVIPQALAENCGVKSQHFVSNLYAAHEAGNVNAGFDVEGSTDGDHIIDAKEKGIFDGFLNKQWMLKYAVTASVTVLRVDQIIMAKRAGGPKAPQQNPNWDA